MFLIIDPTYKRSDPLFSYFMKFNFCAQLFVKYDKELDVYTVSCLVAEWVHN